MRVFGWSIPPDSAVNQLAGLLRISLGQIRRNRCQITKQSSGAMVLPPANACSTGKLVDNQFLTQNSHFPTAPLSSRGNNVMQYSERRSQFSFTGNSLVVLWQFLVAAIELQLKGLNTYEEKPFGGRKKEGDAWQLKRNGKKNSFGRASTETTRHAEKPARLRQPS
jgi:hypothetical protein